MSRLRAHPNLSAAGVLLAALLAWFPDLLVGEQLGQSHVLWSHFPWLAERPADLGVVPRSAEVDAVLQYHPFLVEARRQLLDGHLPLWNPYIFAGMPLLGDWQAGWLFPLNWPALALGVEVMWGPIHLLKLLAGGFGAFVLARSFGVRWSGALVSGLVFMLSAPNLVWLQWPLASAFCLLPWLVLATDRVVRAPDRRRLAALGAVVALDLLAGHPETALLNTSAAGVYGLALAVRLRGAGVDGGVRPARAALAWLGGHVLGVGIAAAVVLPFLEAFEESITRSDHGVLADASLPAWSAIVLALPNLFGDGRPDYSGPPLSYLIVAGYSGVVAGLLAAVGAWRGRARPEALALAAMALVSLAVIFGIPPFSWIVGGVPPWSTGNNIRIFHVVALVAAVGAGAGVHALLARPMALRAALALAAGTGLVVLVWAVGLLAWGKLPAERSVEVRALLRFALALAAGGALLVALGRVRRTGLVVAAVCLVTAGDAAYLRGHNVVLPAERAYPAPTGALRALSGLAGGETGGVGAGTGPAEPVRVASLWEGPFGPFVLPPNTSMLPRIETVQGYDYPPSRRWADFSRDVLGQVGLTRELFFNVSPTRTRASLAGMRAMGVRYLLTRPGAPAPGPGLRRRYAGRDGIVWEDPAALPRAFLIGAERRTTEAGALAAFRAGTADPRREVLLERGAPRLASGTAPPAALRPAAARWVAPDRLRITVPAGARGGWLVVGQGHWPSWKATVDGADAPLVPANHTAMAVPLAPGARTVEVSLDRTISYLGFAISGFSLLLCVGLGLGRPRPRSRREPV